MSDSFILGVLVVLALVIVLRKADGAREWFERFVTGDRDRSPPLAVPKPEPPQPEPPESKPPIEIKRLSNYGNIKLLSGEEQEPVMFAPDVHDFPDMKAALTRFEDFNRRLFIAHLADMARNDWPNTTSDDFPTRISGASQPELLKQIHLRLRPRYPVIYDSYGHWAWISYQLEQNPDFTDDITETYLAIPEDVRPVVISSGTLNRDGYFIFMRYGFENYRLNLASMRPHLKACLELVFEAFTGTRDKWLWFSVARMRQTAIRAHQHIEAQRNASKLAVYLEKQAAEAKREKEHQNRFVALFKHRIDFPAAPALQAPREVDLSEKPAASADTRSGTLA